MKLKLASIFILLSVFCLQKMETKHVHSQTYLISNQNIKTDNLVASNLLNNYKFQEVANNTLQQDVIQDDQIDEEDESFDTNHLTALQNNIFSFLNNLVLTNQSNDNIASVLDALSSKKYILFNVFRI